MPCLSISADSDLNESIRVSNAESQLAVPLTMTTVFGASVISSPKGSAVWTVAAAGGVAAGVSAVDGVGAAAGLAAGAGVDAGAGAGVADTAGGAAGVLAAGAAAGDCASATARPSEIAAAGTSATMARRKQRRRFIRYSPWSCGRAGTSPDVPGHGGEVRL